jgi:hypothetical protein
VEMWGSDMWINRKEWEALQARVSALEWDVKVYGPSRIHRIGNVVEMILSHFRLHIHDQPSFTELRSKDGPERG